MSVDSVGEADVSLSRSPALDIGAAAIVVVGVVLRGIQAFGGRSLWLDEILLADNIRDLPAVRLIFGRLALDQSAPAGFLAAERIAVGVFGFSDQVLRLVPFVAAVGALIGFAVLARRLLDPVGALAALGVFAVAPSLIGYAGQVKQYSSDVAVCVLLLLLALAVERRFDGGRSLVGCAIAGGAAVWFSQPAVFVVVGAGSVLIARSVLQRTGRPLRPLIVTVAVWAGSAAFAVVVGVLRMSTSTRGYLQAYWSAGFLPSPPSPGAVVRWPLQSLRGLFGANPAGMAVRAPGAWAALATLGLVLLVARRPWHGALVVAPILLALAGGVVRQYPFADRLILFLVPSLTLGLGELVGAVGRVARSGFAGCAVAFSVVAVFAFPVVSSMPPYATEEMRPALQFVAASSEPGDDLYVFSGAELPYDYYARQINVEGLNTIVGGCHRGVNREYLRELDQFRGDERVWIVITHSVPAYHERGDIEGYLDQIGTRRFGRSFEGRAAHGIVTEPVDVVLYDLSDRSRLESANASTFELTPTQLDPRFVC